MAKLRTSAKAAGRHPGGQSGLSIRCDTSLTPEAPAFSKSGNVLVAAARRGPRMLGGRGRVAAPAGSVLSQAAFLSGVRPAEAPAAAVCPVVNCQDGTC